MSDMSQVIVAKSDQVNAGDLVGISRTVRIAAVNVQPGTEQPVAVKIEGDNKVYRPCKSMSRVLVAAWGADSAAYKGRSMTLYCDPDVLWAGMKVGGIRISHMSHIDSPITLALAENKKNRKLFTVKPLPTQRPNTPAAANPPAAPAETPITDAGQNAGAASNGPTLAERMQRIIDRVNKAADREALAKVQTLATAALAEAEAAEPVFHALAVGAIAARNAVFDGADDGFGGDDA